jgi:1-acyl-sn-glycerol-3-phosphate acyltransferase
MMDAPLYRLALALRPLVTRFPGLEVSGLEHLPEGGCVICIGHFSYLDPLPVALAIPRRLRVLGTRRLFGLPIGRLYWLVGGVPVSRGRGDRGALARAVALVADGEALAIFVEGRRRRKGLLHNHSHRVHRGAARIALAAGVPLVPVGLQGTDHLLRLAPFRLVIGAPLHSSGSASAETTRAEASRLTDELWQQMQALEQA